jgi:hypothetical protein
MVYLKSIAVGIAVGIVTVAVTAGAVVIGTLAWLRFEMWRQQAGGSGGIGAVSAGLAEALVMASLVLGLVGFVAGFWWQFRRGSRAPSP